MYRVAIVDDEQIVKLAVNSMIDWASGEFELAGTAGDGQAALQFLEQSPVDILITDLKMPRMDGVELIGILRDRANAPAVIVLSNHGEFELVRNAMRHGARDYLLKTDITPEILMKSLREIAGSLSPRQERPGPTGRNAFLVRISDGLSGLERRLMAPEPDERGCALVVVAAPAENQVPGADGKDVSGILAALAEQRLKSCRRCLCAQGPVGETILAILVPPEAQVQPAALARWLGDQAKLYYGCELGLAHSPLVVDRSHYPARLADCLRLAEQFFFAANRGGVLSMEEQALPQSSVDEGRPAREETPISDWVVRMAAWACRYRLSPGYLKREIIDTLAPDLAGASAERCLPENILAASSDQELVALFNDYRADRYRVEVCKVLDYIAAHPVERISVLQLAQMVRMSETYLCTVFKAQTGKSIISYINDAKLDRARDLLVSGKYLIKEVAAEVGIDDPFYFNRLFKRRFGAPPRDSIP